MSSASLVFRPLQPSDHNLILSTWLRNNEPDARISKTVYFSEHQKKIKALFFKAPATFTILADAESPDHVYGWLCADVYASVLHFVYVKSPYRRMHFARQLMAHAFGPTHPDFHSHETESLPRLRLSSVYNPYTF